MFWPSVRSNLNGHSQVIIAGPEGKRLGDPDRHLRDAGGELDGFSAVLGLGYIARFAVLPFGRDDAPFVLAQGGDGVLAVRLRIVVNQLRAMIGIVGKERERLMGRQPHFGRLFEVVQDQFLHRGPVRRERGRYWVVLAAHDDAVVARGGRPFHNRGRGFGSRLGGVVGGPVGDGGAGRGLIRIDEAAAVGRNGQGQAAERLALHLRRQVLHAGPDGSRLLLVRMRAPAFHEGFPARHDEKGKQEENHPIEQIAAALLLQ